MQELVQDLRTEYRALYELVAGLPDARFTESTPFKSWTVHRVIEHLWEGDAALLLSMTDEAGFVRFRGERKADLGQKDIPPARARLGLPALTGQELNSAWRDGFETLCDKLGEGSPKSRIKWVGPDMSLRSAATARLMEVWAHGQDIYDLLRQPRTHHDRIRNIAHLGANTFGWTFQNRGQQPPGPMPYVSLTAPSGAVWTWGEENSSERISGSAVEFCQVVTQGRNIGDVNLKVEGDIAKSWMAIAQCFAGPPNDPPAPGSRSW